MKKLFLLFTLSLFTLSFVNAQEEIVFSENIQDTFFGVKFGASREEVIRAFEKEGLYLDNMHSTNAKLFFKPLAKYFSFGGMSWDFIQVHLSNGKFYLIQFAHENNETVLNELELLLSSLASKYKMNDTKSIEDKTYYKKSFAISDDNFVQVSCKRVSTDSEIKYRIYLLYMNDKLKNKPSDEL